MYGEKIGKYRIIGHIDSGGMADVFKALHPELNRVVALKVLNRALLHSPEMLERFRREARAIATLRHPNIVQVYDLDVVEGVYFMVMEYIEGETLSQRLNRLHHQGKRIPLPEMLHIVVAVGEALHYAHEQGMLHRDIKPANIMFRSDGSVVLADFGVAKILNASSSITASGAVAGTPAYMAPEQWTSDEPDKRSDIYSLGVVLYQVVTGELPFTAETPGRLMFKHLSEPPPSPRKLFADIPLELELVILRAMAKEPQERYQTAQELVADLREVLYEVESTAPTGVFKRPSRAALGERGADLTGSTARRRSPLLWLGAGALILLALIIGLFNSGFLGPITPSATPDATVTALALRLAALEATLAVGPVRSRTPSATPGAPTQTPAATITLSLSPVLSPSPSPTGCVLAMTLVEDVNFSNPNWWSTVNARFEKTWRLRNDGACPWPQGVVLAYLDGEAFGLAQPFVVDSLEAGAELELVVTLRAPGTPGQYAGRFQLQTAAGEPVGEPLAVELEARPRASLTPSATPGAPEPVRVAGFDLVEWSQDTTRNVWRGKVRLWARGGTGQYVWYRDTLDNRLPGDVLEFQWGICRDFFGSVWVTSGDSVDHEGLYIPYPGPCD